MDQTLPQNKEAEMRILSNIFQKNDILAEMIGIIEPQDFYSNSHNIVYSKFLEMYQKDIPIDIITLSNNLTKETLQSIGGITYLSNLATSSPSTVNNKTYVKIIKELSVKRHLIKMCQETLLEAYMEDSNSQDIINHVESKILTTGEQERNKTITAQELMSRTVDKIEDGFKKGGKIVGISTGYSSIDKATNGFVKGDLFILAARPSMGKTALVMNIMNKINANAALFEMEMAEEKLGVRMLAPKTMLDSQKLSKGQIKEIDFATILTKASEISKKDNIFLNCKGGLTTGEILSESKKIKLQHGLDVVFIDHIGKIKPDNLKASRNDQIGQISEDLKNMAKDLDVCVVALSQLNRNVESRQDKHPMLSDLRDSGNIEQDADEILMLYREDYYAERECRESKNPNILEAMVAKNRDGEAGLIKLVYKTNYQLITEVAKECPI